MRPRGEPHVCLRVFLEQYLKRIYPTWRPEAPLFTFPCCLLTITLSPTSSRPVGSRPWRVKAPPSLCTHPPTHTHVVLSGRYRSLFFYPPPQILCQVTETSPILKTAARGG